MASIIKRKKSYSLVYNYTNEKGETKQKWETWHSHKEVLKRKAEVEGGILSGDFKPPSDQTIEEFLYDFVIMYGERKWGVTSYDSNMALMANYINPIIGQQKIRGFNAYSAEKYITVLRETVPVSTKYRKTKKTELPDKTIERIVRLLNCAFERACRWGVITKNPFKEVDLPKSKYQQRPMWNAELIAKALDACTDTKLYVAMNIAFACSCRLGEICGLTWDKVHISDDAIARDDAFIYIDKELERVSMRAVEKLKEKEIMFIFPSLLANTSTRLVLKLPKTESSIRKIWLPKTLALILRKWKESQDEIKSYLGDEYVDYNLVIALPNGRPCEGRIINKAFVDLKKEADMPNVTFHSLRSSSTTYKLKLNNGDIKATQGDTGHTETDMITRVYAHILDEDRKVNAQKFETAFYANPDLRNVQPVPEPAPAQLDLNTLVAQLQENPELLATLSQLLGGNQVIRAAV